MAYDEALAQALRADLAHLDGVTERKMFGGLCLMLDGNMVCGVHRGGGLFRVGRDGMAAALALPGVRPMEMGGRRMQGFVEAEPAVVADPGRRAPLMAMSLAVAQALPPK